MEPTREDLEQRARHQRARLERRIDRISSRVSTVANNATEIGRTTMFFVVAGAIIGTVVLLLGRAFRPRRRHVRDR